MTKILTPIAAIRQKCLDCMAGQFNEVRACPIVKCSLWYHRLGIRPTSNILGKNPFLQPTFFEGKHHMKASELIKQLKKLGGDGDGENNNSKVSE